MQQGFRNPGSYRSLQQNNNKKTEVDLPTKNLIHTNIDIYSF